MTEAKKNDHTQMNQLVHEPGVTYVFDPGYIDYSAFERYYLDGILFVTRLKSNTHIEPLEEVIVPEGSKVSADWYVRIGSQQKKMKHMLRMIQTQDSEGNLFFLVTNLFDLTSEEFSEMYRSRWAIETFFKWMKQHMQIKHLYGTSEQEVTNQIWIALVNQAIMETVWSVVNAAQEKAKSNVARPTAKTGRNLMSAEKTLHKGEQNCIIKPNEKATFKSCSTFLISPRKFVF